MMKIKPWFLLLVSSLVGVSLLLILMYSGLSGNAVKDNLYVKNVEGRLISVSNYINKYIEENSRLPKEEKIRKIFNEKDIFKCLLTDEPLIFIPDLDKQDLNTKKLLIFNPKSYFAKKQKYGSFGDGRKVRNKHSFHISLVLTKGQVHWESLSSADFFDILLAQLENDTVSSDEDNKEVIIKVIEHYLAYSSNP